MASTQPRRRHRTLVDLEVQGSLIRKIVLHWALLFLANTLGLMIWLRMFEQPDVGWSETFIDCVRRFFPFFLISIALVPAFVWDTLKATSRFAGPMLRLRRAIADASRGRAVKPLHFRGSDFWQEVAEHFNVLMEQRNDRTSADKQPSPSPQQHP